MLGHTSSTVDYDFRIFRFASGFGVHAAELYISSSKLWSSHVPAPDPCHITQAPSFMIASEAGGHLKGGSC